MAYNKDDRRDQTKQVKKYTLTLYSREKMETLLKKSEFSDISITYYKSMWIPFKDYVVPRGMIVKAKKPKN